MSHKHFNYKVTNEKDSELCMFCDHDKQLREQLAKEIPELVVSLKAYWIEQSEWDGFGYISDENFERILNFVAANLVRGNDK